MRRRMRLSPRRVCCECSVLRVECEFGAFAQLPLECVANAPFSASSVNLGHSILSLTRSPALSFSPTGTIESHELRHVMGELGEQPTDEELEDMIRAVDLNGDGGKWREERILSPLLKRWIGYSPSFLFMHSFSPS